MMRHQTEGHRLFRHPAFRHSAILRPGGWLFGAALALTAGTGKAECVDYTQYLHFTGQYAGLHLERALHLEGHLGYAAIDSGGAWVGLQILDLSEPLSPLPLGSYKLRGTDYFATDIQVADRRAYLTGGAAGLIILDVSDSMNPRLVTRLPSGNASEKVQLRGDYAYVADFDSLRIARVGHVPLPYWAGAVGGTKYESVIIQGSLAYAYDAPTLRVFDLTSPAAPAQIGSLTLLGQNGWGQSLAVNGSWAYVAGRGLFSIDISQPAHPVLRSRVEDAMWLSDLAVQGSTAFAHSDFTFGLLEYDLSDPALPQRIGQPGQISGPVAFSGDIAYVLGMGYWVLDLTHRSGLPAIGALHLPAQSHGLVTQGDLAYVGADGAGLLVVDASDPAHPTIVSTTPVPGDEILEVRLSSHYAVAGTLHGLQMIDVSDASHPSLAGRLDTPSWIANLAIGGTTACGVEPGYAVDVIDISDPDAPRLLQRMTGFDGPQWVAISGSYAFVADATLFWERATLRVVRLSGGPPYPIVATVQLGPGGPYGLALSGTTALCNLAGDPGPRLCTINVSNPLAPFVVNSIHAGSSWSVEAYGPTAVLAGKGVQLVDLSAPGAPVLCGNVGTPESSSWTVAFTGQAMLVTDGITPFGNSLRVFPLPCASSGVTRPPSGSGEMRAGVELQVSPNPLRDQADLRFRLDRAGAATLSVFDAAGRLRNSWKMGVLGSGVHSFRIKTRDDAGRPLAPGVYWLRLEASGERAVQTMIVGR